MLCRLGTEQLKLSLEEMPLRAAQLMDYVERVYTFRASQGTAGQANLCKGSNNKLSGGCPNPPPASALKEGEKETDNYIFHLGCEY